MKVITASLLLWLLTAATTHAEGCLGPRHRVRDWTVSVAGNRYGLYGYGADTVITLGKYGFRLPAHIFVVTGGGGLALGGLGLLALRAARKATAEA